MTLRERAADVGTVLVVVLVVVLLFGQLLGQPVLLGYVTTGSMEPALSPGDGFVAVPSVVAGDPAPGDVVVFRAEEVQGGGLTTHRVVDETPEGYVTKGDANPFTDQDGGEPPVTEDRIVAHAFQFGGSVVAIPFLGDAVGGLQALVAVPFSIFGAGSSGTVLVFAGIALFVLAGALGEGRQTDRSRDRANVLRAWTVVLFVAVVLTGAATAGMVLPSGTHDVEFAVAEDPGEDPQVARPGGTASLSYEVHNGGAMPVLVMTDPLASGTTTDPNRATLGFDQRTSVTVRMDAPRREGTYTRPVRESRYLLVLPPGLLAALHRVDPLLALLAVDTVVAGFVVTGGVAIFGTGYFRMRATPNVPLSVRARRRWRQFRR
ncbi:signal peptidase I [Haloglomus litoreum]|uniref:signal peptidase I n=1 Tax=Haloglomus litoreum TaxID=3034026 RepID=UPI0023E7C387|nr:signal peptidase I [Haloglomus sp. DT116]